jgi:hypothetical protein
MFALLGDLISHVFRFIDSFAPPILSLALKGIFLFFGFMLLLYLVIRIFEWLFHDIPDQKRAVRIAERLIPFIKEHYPNIKIASIRIDRRWILLNGAELEKPYGTSAFIGFDRDLGFDMSRVPTDNRNFREYLADRLINDYPLPEYARYREDTSGYFTRKNDFLSIPLNPLTAVQQPKTSK